MEACRLPPAFFGIISPPRSGLAPPPRPSPASCSLLPPKLFENGSVPGPADAFPSSPRPACLAFVALTCAGARGR